MFKLESKNLKREFKVIDGALFASQITNTESGMQFIRTETVLNLQ